MKALSFLALAITVSLLTGCERALDRVDRQQGQSAVHTGGTETDYVAHLRAKARNLARAELARLSAAELLYHNRTYYYEVRVVNITSGAYAKMYREFTGFRIADIRRSDSILRPITVVIEFEYDLLGTEAEIVAGPHPESANTAQNNYDFQIYRHETILIEYPCWDNGEPLGGTGVPLQRPNYWDEGVSAPGDQFTMHEVEGSVRRRPVKDRRKQ